MSDEKPLVDTDISDIAGLSKPATVFIEKMSKVGVWLFGARHIKHEAEAKSYAKIIEAETDIKIADIQQRAMQRLVYEEGKKQENMEAITLEATKHIKDDAKPEDMGNDWIVNFFDKCRLVSDKEMQILWANILAGEANKPGTFSQRTVNLVSELDKSDAQMFTELMTFSYNVYNICVPLIYSYEDEIYKKNNLHYESLIHLDDIGLVSFQNVGGNNLGTKFITTPPKEGCISYYDEKFLVNLNKEKENNTMKIGQVFLTVAGEQLAPIAGGKPSEEFKQYVLEKWRSLGYVVEKISSEENQS